MSNFRNYDYGGSYKKHSTSRRRPIIRGLIGVVAVALIYNFIFSPSSSEEDGENNTVTNTVPSNEIDNKNSPTLTPVTEPQQKKPSNEVATVTPLSTKKVSSPQKDTEIFLDSDMDMEHYYSLQKDSSLAAMIKIRLNRHKPTGAFILLVDGKSNEVLAWGERKDSLLSVIPDFISRATFPAASLSKIVTAAAALESKKYSNASQLPQIGRTVTLYRRQVNPPKNYSGHTVSLEKAFSLSMNPAFAVLGARVGAKRMHTAAEKLGFNTTFPNNIPHRSEFLQIDSGYALKEAASGFTELNTISPLQAAGIARSVLYGKPFELPWSKELAGYIHHKPIDLKFPTFSDETYAGLRKMFNRTTKAGTARTAMRKHVYRSNQRKYITGGKTGSLDGSNPAGRYDWFLGWAYNKDDIDDAVIMVVMQYHGEYRSLKSSDMAGLMVNYWERYISRNKDIEVAQQ
ncbi:MAG: penicillin-binding transpeptidase domain-containing protein [Fibrobacterales bacterium]